MATFSSVEYAQQQSSFQKASVDTIAKLFLAKFSYTQVGAGTIGDDVSAIELPAGKITIYPDLSRLVTSAGGGSGTTSVGLRAYTSSANATVAADTAKFESLRATSGATDAALALPAVGKVAIDSRNGVVVSLTNGTTAMPNAMTLDGWIAYTRG